MLAGKAINPMQNSAQGQEKGTTRKQIAEIADVSHDTIKKVKKLNESEDDETKGKLRRDEVSVRKAYDPL